MIKSFYKNNSLTLGILGGGQLAKMLALSAYRLGLNVAIIDKEAGTPAGDMTKLEFTKGWENSSELDKFIEVSDIVTLENEFIAPEILEYIAQKRQVFPSAKTMRLIQDKFIQKSVFAENNIELPDFNAIASIEDMLAFGKKYSYPFIVKTRTLGYDGYGNFTIYSESDCKTAFDKFQKPDVKRDLMAERFIDFQAELAVMVARNKQGEIAVYPCVESIQKNHICHKIIAPARISKELANKAKEIAVKCVKVIDGVGVFGVELFLTKDNRILINEIAPRPHNSGHYTIEACYTSQYENAIRAILGLPLGSTDMLLNGACMINILGEKNGSSIPVDITKSLENGKTSLHLYNKKQSRVGRKIGHVTAVANSVEEAIENANDMVKKIVW